MKPFIASGLLLFIVLVCGTRAFASDGDSTRTSRWYVPHRVPFQLAGNIGLFSTGVGVVFNRGKYEADFLYGYVPASVAESRIHTLAVKNTFPLAFFSLKDSRILIPYLGVGLTLEVGGNSFFKMPDSFPDGYYDMPKNLHVIGYGGVRLRHLFANDEGWLHGIEFYAEGGTVDVYVWYKAISNTVKFNQVFSLALGVNLLLKNGPF